MINNEIIFMVKFGEKKHLKSLELGNIFFSNASKFREIENEQLLKGQGDRGDGLFSIYGKDVKIKNDNTIYESGKTFDVDCGNNSFRPVFCITAGTLKDCSYFNNEKDYRIQFSEKKHHIISEHFPKADSVLLIKNPQHFLDNLKSNIGYKCYENLVQYYNPNRILPQFLENLFYDSVYEDIETGIRETVVDVSNVHRLLICKDIFFLNNKNSE